MGELSLGLSFEPSSQTHGKTYSYLKAAFVDNIYLSFIAQKLTTRHSLVVALICGMLVLSSCAGGGRSSNYINSTTDASPMEELNAIDPQYFTTHISNSIEEDTDGDGIINAYDFYYDNRSVQVVGDGTSDDPFLIRNIYQLQAIAGLDHNGRRLNISAFTNNTWLYGMDAKQQLSSSYALSGDIDALPTANWQHNINSKDSAQADLSTSLNRTENGTNENITQASFDNSATIIIGFLPIGNCGDNDICNDEDDEPFMGNFTGGNYIIDNLHQNRTDSAYSGLFGSIGEGGRIDSLGLTSLVVYGKTLVGALAAISSGEIHNSYIIGFVSGNEQVGGLIGKNTGKIIDSYAIGEVVGNEQVGGLSGVNNNIIDSSHAVSRISKQVSKQISNGGQAGEDVKEQNFGGLVGLSSSSSIISASYASGLVNGTDHVGGMVGENQGMIFNSYASVTTLGREEIGGLVGRDQGQIIASYALGDVVGQSYVGGLVGFSSGEVGYSYARGAVTGNSRVGGLVGFYNSRSPLDVSYASGLVKGDDSVGGLVGFSVLGFSSSSYWDVQTSTQPRGVGESPDGILDETQPLITSQITGCALNGIRLAGSPDFLNCNDLFPAYLWGQHLYAGISSANYAISWDFATADSYPRIVVRDGEQNTKIPPAVCVSGLYEEGECSILLDINDATAGTELGRVIVFSDSHEVYSYALQSVLSDLPQDLFEVRDDSASSGLITLQRDANEDDEGTYTLVILASQREDSRIKDEGEFLLTEQYPVEFQVTLMKFEEQIATPEDDDADGVQNEYDDFPDDPIKFVDGEGSMTNPYVIRNIYQLQAIAGLDHNGIALNDISSATKGRWLYGGSKREQLNKHYILGNIIWAAVTRYWREGGGFIPIGSCTANDVCADSFNGSLNGAGNIIIDPTINSFYSTNGVGIFGALAPGVLIRDIIIRNANIFGGFNDVGILAGYAREATIINSSVAGTVIAANPQSDGVGALLGDGAGALIVNSNAETQQVRGISNVGGLVGNGRGTRIISSYATNDNVRGSNNIGGLLGNGEEANIVFSHSSSREISGTFNIGGLAGNGRQANILFSYVAGAVDARGIVSGNILGSNIFGNEGIGGMLGNGTFANITASYVTGGSILGADYIGGLIGDANNAIIRTSYSAMNQIEGAGLKVGGLVGHVGAEEATTTVVNSYWDYETTGITMRLDVPAEAQGIAKESSELQNTTDFSSGIYELWASYWCNPNAINNVEYSLDGAASYATDENIVWDLGYDTQYPALKCSPQGLSVLQGRDKDGDGIIDSIDTDDDGDGILDVDDLCPAGETAWTSDSISDIDVDGCRNDEDTDIDNDGILNTADLCPAGVANWVSNKDVDYDGDGCRYDEDDDRDNDGILDTADSCPLGDLGWISSPTTDFDGDGCRNSEDDDDDNDGFPDNIDAFDFDPNEYQDADGDSIGDNADDDADNDGVADDIDIDDDGDGLIEISTIAGLNNIRYSLSGNRLVRYFGDIGISLGCGGLNGIVLCNGYELMVDLSLETTYFTWQPIGECVTNNECTRSFDGVFDGNGRIIRDLTMINSYPAGVGLFASFTNRAVVRNLRMRDVTITTSAADGVGALVGYGGGAEITDVSLTTAKILAASAYGVGSLVGDMEGGSIRNAYAVQVEVQAVEEVGGLVGRAVGTEMTSASVLGAYVRGSNNVGGLVGNGQSARITSSRTNFANVRSYSNNVGGLVGWGRFAEITSSIAFDAIVRGVENIGGLVGDASNGIIRRSYVDRITATADGGTIGGLVGRMDEGAIMQCSVEGGTVAGSTSVGGLLGSGTNGINVTSSSVTLSSVSGTNSVAGLVARGDNIMIDSSSADVGQITGNSYVAGLLAWGASATIRASYTKGGNIFGGSFVGGLVGDGSGATIKASYAAAGPMTGLLFIAGLIAYPGGDSFLAPINRDSGYSRTPTILVASYWDRTVSGQGYRPGIVPGQEGEVYLTAELQTPTTFGGIYSEWDNYWCDPATGELTEDSTSTFATTDNLAWNLGDSNEYPYLTCGR